MLTSRRKGLLRDLLAPTPGRLERTLELAAVTSIVVLISMAYRLPEPGLSAYIVYFVSKEDAGRTIVTSMVFVVAITVVIGASFALLPHTLNEPGLRILFIAGVSFGLFFLGSASKLAPLAGTLGLILASALNAEQSLPTGEIASRALLYILLVTVFPILVQIAFNMCAGRQPDQLLRQGLQARLLLAAAAFRNGTASLRLQAAIAAGNTEMQAQLKMAGLLHRLPKDALARLKLVVTASFGVLLAIRSRRDELTQDQAEVFAGRLEAVAASIAAFPAQRGKPAAAADDAHPVAALVAAMEDAASDAPLPAPKSAPKQAKSGFFKPGAFTDPVHERFAAKATAAAVTCYLAFNLADWSKISTCLVTVFIVALSTNGESTQKMTLRITGCVLGAALGYAAIVFALPHTTGISGLLMLMACITLPAAWVSFGSPRVSYIGFQMAFAAYLCVLQGSEPKFDLTVARDRFVGILFGNVVVYLYFVSVYPASLLPGLTRQLVAILERCRAVVRSAREIEPVLALVGEVAEVQALVGRIDQAVTTYGFEKRASRFARLHVLACHLIQRSLHALVAEIATLATLPAAERREEACADVEARLDALAEALGRHTAIDTDGRRPPHDVAGRARRVIGAIHDDINRLAVSAARYRRIMQREGGGLRA